MVVNGLLYLYLIIGWVVRVSRIGPLKKVRTDGVGQYKTPGMRTPSERSADAPEARFSNEFLIDKKRT